MAKNRYYYYDHDSCAFVEVKQTRSKLYVRMIALATIAVFLAGLVTLGMDRMIQSPQELALQDENSALRAQLNDVSDRIQTFSEELDRLAEADRDLYRSFLQIDPLSDDIRQVGVGGTDPYAEFSRFSTPTAEVLQRTSQQISRLERQIGVQNESYRELAALAVDHEEKLAQMPAILPTNGQVVSGYGMRFHPILRVRRMHPGIDVYVPKGTAVVASGDGIVREIRRSTSYGIYVRVEHAASGYSTLYAHLSSTRQDLRVGARVSRGELLAYSGSTGLSKGPHLHYEVRDGNNRTLNPVQFFAPSMTPAAYQALIEATENSTTSFD